MITRLRLKFICTNMIIVTLMLLVIFGLVLGLTARNMEAQSFAMMQTVADKPMPKRPGHGDSNISTAYFALEKSPSGIIATGATGYYDLSDEELLNNLYELAVASDTPMGILHEYGLRFCKSDNPMSDKIVFVDASVERNTLQSLMKTCGMIGISAFAVFFLISVLLSLWETKPVENAWQQQRQFISDASHELKTPLTVILANIDLLRQSQLTDSQNKNLDSISIMSTRMKNLVESLLDLARSDCGRALSSKDTIDLSPFLYECLLPFEPIYFEQGLELESDIADGIRIIGDSVKLHQCIDILLDNAQKYSSPAGKVSVSLAVQGKRYCVLTVSNPCEEISRSDCKNIFKRFYRLDSSRTGSGSYGLGLPIAESIVRSFGGTIRCEYAGARAHFIVRLPRIM